MNADTVNLLKECTSGCEMAIGSMDQVEASIKDSKLSDIIAGYKKKHQELDQEAIQLLGAAGETKKEPKAMAAAFSWVTTEMKLMIEEDSHQIAKLMMDGCNMGIQAISEHQNQYTAASEEAKNLAQRLVRVEENFVLEMKQFL